MITVPPFAASLQLILTEEMLSEVLIGMSHGTHALEKKAFQLLNAFDTPRIAYNELKKQFSLLGNKSETDKRSIFGDALHKVDMLLQRYLLIQQRILRQENFRARLAYTGSHLLGNDGSTSYNKITSVESLLGTSGVRFLLGMIVQVEEGKYYLEDLTTQIPMNLSNTTVLNGGYITENCVVLIEGEIMDGILHVHNISNPTCENRLDAINIIGLQSCDIFNAIPSYSELIKMRALENEHCKEAMFVILSDVHLDNPHVLSKIDKLFCGFVGLVPLPVFVFMGNFCSRALSLSRNGPKEIIGYYDDLAHIICKYPRIAKNGKIIFIPGPDDPGTASVMPRPPIPLFFTVSIRSKVTHAVFASNPCRIRYFSKEFVLCRQDILDKLRYNNIFDLRKNNNYHEDHSSRNGVYNNKCLVQYAVKTILDQGHLCPLPLSSSPIYWQYDHVLRLYPPPDVLIIGDRNQQYRKSYCKCEIVNPGPFFVDFSFLVYRPVGDFSSGDTAKSCVDFSQID